jgi:hypothetical protein
LTWIEADRFCRSVLEKSVTTLFRGFNRWFSDLGGLAFGNRLFVF